MSLGSSNQSTAIRSFIRPLMERLNTFKTKANEFAANQRGKVGNAKGKGLYAMKLKADLSTLLGKERGRKSWIPILCDDRY